MKSWRKKKRKKSEMTNPGKIEIRELMEIERERLLTATELARLPVGTKIMIKWNGGNGPWEYTLQRINGTPWAAEAREIIKVGNDRWHDRVFLPRKTMKKTKPDLAERVARKIVKTTRTNELIGIWVFDFTAAWYPLQDARLRRDGWIGDIANRLREAGVRGR